MPGRIGQVGKTKLNAGGSTMHVDISRLSLNAGVYFLKIQEGGKMTDVFKLVIE